MIFAKTYNSGLVKFPYTATDLREENPYSRYDDRFTLSEWYAKTEDAAATGAAVVEVIFSERPEHNADTHYLVHKQTPELIDGVWTLGWEILERPPFVDGVNANN